MTSKRSTSKSASARRGKRKTTPDTKAIATAIRGGREAAAQVFEQRAAKRTRRHAAVRRHAQTARRKGGAEAALAETFLARASIGTLVAEGDSWFDYPLHDVLSLLDDDYGYDVHSTAHKGDAVEVMAYGEGQLDDFSRCLEQVLRSGTAPKAILLSGGGNDVAGDAFAMLINHRLSPVPGLNAFILQGVLQERIRLAYVRILSAVTQLSTSYLGRALPILMHGYSYPVPDGRGFLGGWGPLPGPWLEPGFRAKGYADLVERIRIAEQLIDAFNGMIEELVAMPDFAHVRYIDLRPELSNRPADYRKWWANELHPTGRGFDAIAARFAAVLAALP